jgi:hypothetical protein
MEEASDDMSEEAPGRAGSKPGTVHRPTVAQAENPV